MSTVPESVRDALPSPSVDWSAHHGIPLMRTLASALTALDAATGLEAFTLPYAPEVQRVLHPPHVGLGERRAPARDLVEVAARDGVVTGVERGLRGRRGEHVHVARQPLVERAAEVGGVDARLEPQVRALR